MGRLPLRVVHEGSPGGITGLPVGIREKVNELPLGVVADRDEIADVCHAMLREELRRVVAKPGMEGIELPGRRPIDAHLVEPGVALGGGGHGHAEEGDEKAGKHDADHRGVSSGIGSVER